MPRYSLTYIIRRRLTKVRTFAVASGIIGLTADVITITSLFRANTFIRTGQAPIPTAGAFVWIASLVLLVYTVVVIGVYVRVYLTRRHREHLNESRERRERGATAITYMLAVPAFTFYLVLLASLFSGSAAGASFGKEMASVGCLAAFAYLGYCCLAILFVCGLSAATDKLATSIYLALL